MILMMLVTAEFNLTDPCVIGKLIQEDHWSHACKLSVILHHLERDELELVTGGVYFTDPCQHVAGIQWDSEQYGSWCNDEDGFMCGYGGGNKRRDAFVWISDTRAGRGRPCNKIVYNKFVNESSAVTLVLKKLDDLVLDKKFNLFPQTFVSRRYLEKAKTMPIWDPDNDPRFMIEETWAKNRRSLTNNCNKALEAAFKIAVSAVGRKAAAIFCSRTIPRSNLN